MTTEPEPGQDGEQANTDARRELLALLILDTVPGFPTLDTLASKLKRMRCYRMRSNRVDLTADLVAIGVRVEPDGSLIYPKR